MVLFSLASPHCLLYFYCHQLLHSTLLFIYSFIGTSTPNFLSKVPLTLIFILIRKINRKEPFRENIPRFIRSIKNHWSILISIHLKQFLMIKKTPGVFTIEKLICAISTPQRLKIHIHNINTFANEIIIRAIPINSYVIRILWL